MIYIRFTYEIPTGYIIYLLPLREIRGQTGEKCDES